MSGTTSQDGAWKAREQSEEARYAHEREQAQIAALRDKLNSDSSTNNNSTTSASTTSTTTTSSASAASEPTHGYEGGFGGQEDLIDKYATTSGEH